MVGAFETINSGILLSFLLIVFLRRNYLESTGWAIFGGILADYFSESPLGFYVINFMVLVFLINTLRGKIALKEMHTSVMGLVVFVGVIFSDVFSLIFFNFLSWIKIVDQIPVYNFSAKYFLLSIVLSIIGLFFYQIMLLVEKIFGIGVKEIRLDKM
jgi:cell shape-determining protein MreD